MKTVLKVLIALILVACILAAGIIAMRAHSIRTDLETAFADLEQFGMEGLRPHLAGTAAEVADEIIENPVTDWINKITQFFTREEPKDLLDDLECTVEKIMLGVDRSAADVHYQTKASAEEPEEADCTVVVDYIDGEWKIVNFTLVDAD